MPHLPTLGQLLASRPLSPPIATLEDLKSNVKRAYAQHREALDRAQDMRGTKNSATFWEVEHQSQCELELHCERLAIFVCEL
jgi:hypothetical protein